MGQLGGFKNMKDARGKKRKIALPNSHVGSVISLDVSQMHPNVLASAGEDGVKLWDLQSMNFLTNVRDKCCTQVRWHPKL